MLRRRARARCGGLVGDGLRPAFCITEFVYTVAKEIEEEMKRKK